MLSNSKIPQRFVFQIQNLASGTLPQGDSENVWSNSFFYRRTRDSGDCFKQLSGRAERPFPNQIQWPSHCVLITFLPYTMTLLIILSPVFLGSKEKTNLTINKIMQRNTNFPKVRLSSVSNAITCFSDSFFTVYKMAEHQRESGRLEI